MRGWEIAGGRNEHYFFGSYKLSAEGIIDLENVMKAAGMVAFLCGLEPITFVADDVEQMMLDQLGWRPRVTAKVWAAIIVDDMLQDRMPRGATTPLDTIWAAGLKAYGL